MNKYLFPPYFKEVGKQWDCKSCLPQNQIWSHLMSFYQNQALSSFLYVHIISLIHDHPMKEIILVSLIGEATRLRDVNYFRASRMGAGLGFKSSLTWLLINSSIIVPLIFSFGNFHSCKYWYIQTVCKKYEELLI